MMGCPIKQYTGIYHISHHTATRYEHTLLNSKYIQYFYSTVEGSLGGNPNNSVAVNKIELEGVKAIQTDLANLMDFENGLFGK